MEYEKGLILSFWLVPAGLCRIYLWKQRLTVNQQVCSLIYLDVSDDDSAPGAVADYSEGLDNSSASIAAIASEIPGARELPQVNLDEATRLHDRLNDTTPNSKAFKKWLNVDGKHYSLMEGGYPSQVVRKLMARVFFATSYNTLFPF